jgi:pyruvate dehydrogenase E2 component (dihydrolipoamide acetyltransferase)
MPTEILMPALSPTMEEGKLAKWLVKEGQLVKAGDIIAEIETDKATMEVEAVDEGKVAKLLVAEGTEGVKVNTPIAVLLGDGESAGVAPVAPPVPKAAAGSPPHHAEGVSSTRRGEGLGVGGAPKANVLRSPPPSPSPTRGEGLATSLPSSNGHNRIFASPLARRLAREAGLDLSALAGSGPHGRIVKSDVETAARNGGARAAPKAGTAMTQRPGTAVAPPQPMADDKILALYEKGSYEVVPHDNMRRIIAQRLTASTQTIPHFYLTIDCVIDKLLAAREEINASAPKNKEGKPAYKLSVNDFVIKALALALQRIPDANVSWTEGAMLKHKHSDVGVAVAMPGGLITPIIRQAEAKSLSVISGEMKDFAARARARKLKPHEYQGGTTAVSNLGMYGIKDFTAVINPPHATILAAGAAEERAIVRNGQIVAAHVMSVTLSCDHRAVDGALGAELIGAFRTLIENPVMMVV